MEEILKQLKDKGQFTISVRQHLISQENGQIKELINFAIALMSVFGVMAGLGFTAFQYINLKSIFFVGEFMVIGSLFYLGFKIKDFLADSAISTSNDIYKYEDEAREIKAAIIEKDEVKMKKMAAEFMESVSSTSPNPRVVRAVIIRDILQNSFIFALFGIILILLSFTCLCPFLIFIFN